MVKTISMQNDLNFSNLFEICKSDQLWLLNNPNIYASLAANTAFFMTSTLTKEWPRLHVYIFPQLTLFSFP